MKKTRTEITEKPITKTEFARTMFPGRSDGYARRLLHDFIMNRRMVTRRLIDLGWRPYNKKLDGKQVRFLQKAIREY